MLKLNPDHTDAYYNLGVIELYNENMEDALNCFNKALRIQPDHLLAANGKKNWKDLLKEKATNSGGLPWKVFRIQKTKSILKVNTIYHFSQ